MKKEIKIIKSLTVFFLALSFLIIAFSCGAKKKSTSTEVSSEELVNSSDSLAINKLSLNKEKIKENSSVSNEKGFEIEYEGCEGDSLFVEKTEADGTKTQMTVKGKGKAKIRSNEKMTDSKEKVISSEIKTESSSVLIQKKLEKKEKKKKAATEVDKKQYNFFSWWWIIVVLIGISILYLNKRFNIIRKFAVFFNLRKSQDEN